ncbi:hypothetical protein [Rubricoccus marinus]|uniref:Uncharacterized protein n=1 Tax=Rubricoccus marinus TaxID=716817 RepID=A0A259TU77_9BACT|nr:hypothetical protein [Rubricoccus marinus]OZC01309.1 hypothetical protein BSZ36_17845 [Rubricoccus marinus]
MSKTHYTTEQAARVITDVLDQTQAGDLIWTRSRPALTDLSTDLSVQPKEHFEATAEHERYVLRVGIDQSGDISHTLFIPGDEGELTALRSDQPALLEPYLKDLYRAVTAQRRLLERAGTGEVGSNRDLATASDLASWAANRRDAQSTLPQLVRRLVTATATDLTRVSVRAGEGVGLPGWDGIVEAAGWSAFVPEGLSVWEMGVGEPEGKAQKDYRKRTDEPGNIDPAATTFVFVSPKRWREKDAWVERRKADGVWKDVRVIDGDDLEAWLETAPSVHAWISDLLGKDVWEAESLERWWDAWSEATRPPLPAAVLISGRDEEVQRVLSFLSETEGSTSVVGDSQDEALAFLAAALAGAPRRLDRSLIVRTQAAWRRLSTWPTPLVLLPTFERPPVASAVQAGHHVIVPLGREAKTSGGIQLPRVRRAGIEKALQEAGLLRDRASDLATLGRRSLFSLRRKLAVNPDADRPEWAEPEHARTIALAVLAGSWNDAAEGDRAAVGEIAGRSYDEVAQALTRWVNTSNPPVRRVGEVWLVAAKADAWALTAHALTSDDLDRFRTVALTVLGGDDPALDLPPDQRAGASILGKQRAHSPMFVNALADTLAMMAVADDDVPLVGGRRGATEAGVVVRTVLDAANEDESGRLWHAASSALPLMAEAAPEVFLSAVESGARDADGPVLTLFQEDTGFLSSSSPHPSLLWALETLAWHPDYLPRAARALAILTRLAPPVKILNRPFNSLQSILVLWSNGTAASLDARVQILDLLRKYEPDVAWSLSLALIPSGSDSTSPPSSPAYRDWKPDDLRRGVRADEFDRALDGVVRRASEYAATDGERWAALVKKTASSAYPVRDLVLSGLEALDPDALTDDGRRALYRTLREIANRHKRYPDAQWSMSPEGIQRLNALAPKFEPTSAVHRNSWLFDREAADAFVTDDEDDYDEQNRLWAIAQDTALLEVLGEIGVGDLSAWVDTLSDREYSARLVGEALARVLPRDTAALDLLTSEDETDRRIGTSYVWPAAQLNGPEWAESVLAERAEQWPAETTSLFLRALPRSPSVWTLAEAWGPEIDKAYWEQVHPFALPSEGEVALEAARKLTAAGRARAALHHFQRILYRDADAVPLDLLADTLEAALQTSEGAVDATTAHDIGKHLDRLDEADFDSDRLAALEWAYLPLFRFDRRQSGVLHRELAENPEFFVQILSFAFRGRGEEPTELTEAEQNRASNAHTLLESWRTVPGQGDDGTIDAQVLDAWVDEARRLLSEANRSEVGDQYIGRVLRYGPEPEAVFSGTPEGDTDAPRQRVWPAEAIRDVIERVASEDLETGFALEVYNSRGTTSRGMTDGGDQERALVRTYRQYAAHVGAMYPRTAAMLKRIADSYLRDAERYDRDAALTEDTWR